MLNLLVFKKGWFSLKTLLTLELPPLQNKNILLYYKLW